MDSWSILFQESWPSPSGCIIVLTINSLLCLRWFIISITREKPVFLQTQVVSVFSHTACFGALCEALTRQWEIRCVLFLGHTQPFPYFLSLSLAHFHSSLTLTTQLSYILWWQPRNKRWTSDGSQAACLNLLYFTLYLLTFSLRSGEAGTKLRNTYPTRI